MREKHASNFLRGRVEGVAPPHRRLHVAGPAICVPTLSHLSHTLTLGRGRHGGHAHRASAARKRNRCAERRAGERAT